MGEYQGQLFKGPDEPERAGNCAVEQKIKFFNPGKLFSHHCGLNIAVSPRGAGKTYSTLKFCGNEYLNKGSQFIYARRTEKEMQKVADKLFSALHNDNVFGDNRFEVIGDTIYHKRGKDNKGIAGFVIPLSMASQYKSASFDKVGTIILDEFIDEKGRYLPDEPEKLLSLIETVFRLRPFRALLLGNLISAYNPYYVYWGIPCTTAEIWKDKKRGILLNNYRSESYENAKAQTPFARLIEDTPYGNFILNNTNIRDNFEGVEKYSGRKDIILTFEHAAKLYAMYRVEDTVYIERAESRAARHYNLEKIFRVNVRNIARNNAVFRILRQFGGQGRLLFGDMESKVACEQIYYVKQ